MKKILLFAVMSIFALAASADSWESAISICGNKITSENVNDLMSLTLGQATEGTISYDHENCILTLNDLKLERTDIWNSFIIFGKNEAKKEYYLKINGHCVFDNKDNKKTAIIAGAGATLIIDGVHGNPEEDRLDIITGSGIIGNEDAIIRCKNVTVNQKDIIYSLCGQGSSTQMAEMSLINSNVTVNDQSGIFMYMKEFRMINCAFVTPADATYNSAKQRVETNGEPLAHMAVEVKAKKTDIENVNQQSQIKNQKVIRDGHILIERNGQLYNAAGARME